MDYFRKCAEMKYRLMPYVYTQAKLCTEQGLPMVRALLIEYPDDPGVWTVEDEYMFGESILVAPMTEDGTSRDVYLPGKQKWIDMQSGKVYSPGWTNIKCGDIEAVILVKDGTALPQLPVAQCTDKLQWDKLSWKHFKADAKSTTGKIFKPGDSEVKSVEF